MQTIPHASIVQSNGKQFNVIPHKQTETKLLNNFGYKIEAPILRHYDWSSTTPFDSQKDTARMLTEHHRAYVLNDMGCVDANTEYLSPTGWKRIADYTAGAVAQYDPKTRQVTFVNDPPFVKLPCEEMIRFKTTRGVDQLLSPEHRMLFEYKGKQEVVPADEFLLRCMRYAEGERDPKSQSRIGVVKARVPTSYYMAGTRALALTESQIRLQVAVIADGHFPSQTSRVVIRVKKNRKIQRLRWLLDTTRTAYKEVESAGFAVFSFDAPRREKEFGLEWWGVTEDQRQILSDELWRWDGSVRAGNRLWDISTTSKVSADFIQHVYSSTGYTATIGLDQRTGKYRGGVCYTVVVSHRTSTGIWGAASDGSAKVNWRIEPTPDGFKYCFMVPTTFLLLRRNGCIFATGNTGKTRAALYAVDFLMKEQEVAACLIVAPLSTLTTVWANEIFQHFYHRSSVVLHGTKQQRIDLLNTKADFYIINHDGMRVMEKELAKRIDINAVILDELALYRNHRTNLWKATNRIAKPRRFVWGMTGSPTPRAPTDAYAQCKLLTPERVPKFFKAFQSETMSQVTQFKWVARKTANDVVFEAMQPSVRYSRADCIDLPETMYTTLEVSMTKDQEKAYKEMLSEMTATVISPSFTGTITAANAGVQLSKLIQVTSGFMYGFDGTRKRVEARYDVSPRINELKRIITAAAGKVIVFAPFVATVDMLYDELDQDPYLLLQYGTGFIRKIHGATSKNGRDQTFIEFQHATLPRVLVAHPGTMSHGLTLTAADTIVWYSPVFSLETYEQANARITRPGQIRHTHIIHIQASKVEKKVYDTLRIRGNMQAELLKLFRGE